MIVANFGSLWTTGVLTPMRQPLPPESPCQGYQRLLNQSQIPGYGQDMPGMIDSMVNEGVRLSMPLTPSEELAKAKMACDQSGGIPYGTRGFVTGYTSGRSYTAWYIVGGVVAAGLIAGLIARR